MAETLADRLNQIIREQHITKREFARRMGVGDTYVYVITGGDRKNHLNQNISPALARVIGMEFSYAPEWVYGGEQPADSQVEELRRSVMEKVGALTPDKLLALGRFPADVRAED